MTTEVTFFTQQLKSTGDLKSNGDWGGSASEENVFEQIVINTTGKNVSCNEQERTSTLRYVLEMKQCCHCIPTAVWLTVTKQQHYFTG